MFVETIETVNLGLGVIEISEKLFPTVKRIFNWIKDGELRIAIFGAGGTGKTTLGKMLSGEFEISNLFPGYQESISIEKYKLDSNTAGAVMVAPGQERRQDSWDDILRDISDGKIKLVINVVSYGYHSFGGFSYNQHPLYQTGMTPEQFMQEYGKERRKRELDVIKKIEPYISISSQKKATLITLLTKQDLWWEERLLIQDYYTKEEYNKLIDGIKMKRGSANFIHEYCSASLVMENLFSGTGELLVPTTQGYDRRLQLANFRNFLNIIQVICETSLNIKGG